MEIYTIKDASRKTKIGIETLKQACEVGELSYIYVGGGNAPASR